MSNFNPPKALNSFNRDFTPDTRRSLKAKGITIYNRTWLPGPDGTFLNGESGYIVDDNGTSKVWTYAEVIQQSNRP